MLFFPYEAMRREIGKVAKNLQQFEMKHPGFCSKVITSVTETNLR